MTTYYIPWSAYGLATVEASNEDEAKALASGGLFNLRSMSLDDLDVDGIEYEVTTEEP